jgi:hypothetical protein
MDLKQMGWEDVRLNSSRSGMGQAAASWEQDYETLGSTKCEVSQHTLDE